MITDAGGHVMSDTCPAISRHMPKGTKVVATDSAKQVAYLANDSRTRAYPGLRTL